MDRSTPAEESATRRCAARTGRGGRERKPKRAGGKGEECRSSVKKERGRVQRVKSRGEKKEKRKRVQGWGVISSLLSSAVSHPLVLLLSSP